MTKQIAEAWRPSLYVEHISGADVLCALPPIDKVNDKTWTYPDRVDSQPVYFKAMEGEGWQAVLYLFYLRNDPKGRHLHDVTGVLRFVRRAYEDIWVQRHHHKLVIEHRSGGPLDRRVLLTAGDHTPYLDCGARPCIDYGNKYPLIDLDSIDLDPYRKAFAPSVTFPDEWSCTRADAFLKTIRGKKLAKKLGIKTVRGLIVKDIPKLIIVLEEMI